MGTATGNWRVRLTCRVIDRLIIENGIVRYMHPDAATDITLNVASSGPSASADTPVHFSGSGRLRRQPFEADGDAASLTALEHGERPYRLTVRMRSGDTRARFDGTVVPHRPDNLDGSLTLRDATCRKSTQLSRYPFRGRRPIASAAS